MSDKICIYCKRPTSLITRYEVKDQGWAHFECFSKQNNSLQSTSSNNNEGSTVASHYQTGKAVAGFISVLGWIFVLLGSLSAFITLVNSNIPLLLASIALIISSFLLIMGAQATKALMDNADSTRELLKHFRSNAK